MNLKVTPSFVSDDQKRMWETIKFIEQAPGKPVGTVLDVGGKNPVGDYMERHFKLKKRNTDCDLDFPDLDTYKETFNNVFVFEVIEHLMNPLLFLINLKTVCHPRTRIYLTYPIRPRLFWAKTHFNEYDKERFRFMLEQAGYEIKRYKQRFHYRPDWLFYLSGIRPFLRLTVGVCRQQMYELGTK